MPARCARIWRRSPTAIVDDREAAWSDARVPSAGRRLVARTAPCSRGRCASRWTSGRIHPGRCRIGGGVVDRVAFQSAAGRISLRVADVAEQLSSGATFTMADVARVADGGAARRGRPRRRLARACAGRDLFRGLMIDRDRGFAKRGSRTCEGRDSGRTTYSHSRAPARAARPCARLFERRPLH